MSNPNEPLHRLRARQRDKKRFRRAALGGALALSVMFVLAGIWVGTRGLLAKNELERAAPLISDISSSIVGQSNGIAGVLSNDLAARTQAAASLTSDPIWRAFELIPAVGPNLTAFREIAQAVKDVSVNAVVPLAQIAGELDPSAFRPGARAIDLQPLIEARPHIAAADAALLLAEKRVDEIDTSSTISQIGTASRQLGEKVNQAAQSIAAVKRAATLLPAMLGANGSRKYLLLFQNNAELRATGGLPGAMALIETNQGEIGLSKQATGASFGKFDRPVLELSAETRGIYTDRVSTYMGDVTLTPNFPTTGQIAREMWKQKYGDDVDGVISLDPIALGYLLRATGPITLATGDVLTSDNAVQLLLSDAYTRYDSSEEQDAFFAAAASAVFGAMAGGQAEPTTLIAALVQAGEERRVLIWSAHKEDQQVLAGTTLAGGLPISDEKAERFGTYFNDATGAKMDTYLDVKIGLGEATCRQDGRPYYAVDVTLANTAPADAASALPESITGPGTYGVQKGNIKTLIVVYGPPSSQNLGMAQNGKKIPYHPATDAGYPVSQIGVELAPGESMTTRAYFLGGSASHGKLEAVSTPVINPNPTDSVSFSCESAIADEQPKQ